MTETSEGYGGPAAAGCDCPAPPCLHSRSLGARLRAATKNWRDMQKPGYWIVSLVALAACGGKDPHVRQVQSLTSRLAEIAAQANQAAPANVDSETRLDGARAGPGLKLTSMYTLVNAESNGVNSTTFEARLAPTVKKASCDNPELRPLIDQGVVVVLE